MSITSNIWWDIFGVITALVVILISYIKWNYTYWRRVGLEYIAPKIPFGNIEANAKKEMNLSEALTPIYSQMKDRGLKHAGIYMLHMPIYMPIHPDLIKQIMQVDFHHFVDRGVYFNAKDDPLSAHLFSIEGQKWRNLRAKLTPTFTSGKIKMMFPIVVKTTLEMLKVIDADSLGQPIEMKDILARLSTDIIGSCAFGIECNSLKNPETDFRKYGKRLFNMNNREQVRGFTSFLYPNLMRFFRGKIIPDCVSEFFMNVIKSNVEYREKNDVKRNDFMQLLIELKNGKRIDDNHDHSNQETTITFEELAAQAFVFFLGGFETSSTTMSFGLLELSQNEDVQDKLREEINDVLEKHDGKLTYEGMLDMHYMDMVINETLRKYPPLPILTRICNSDYKIPGTDVVLEKGIRVFILAGAIQRDPEYFPNPDEFDPNRFTPENKKNIHPFTYLPFGEGPRLCIGMRFGMMQTKIGLSVLLRNYKFKLNRRTSLPVKMDPANFLNSSLDGIWMDVEKINEN